MSNKILGLDGLRGISVILVIMSHAVIWPRIGVTNSGFLSVFSPHVGVNVFFALSGFLITLLLISEKEKTGRISIYNFFMRRLIRIFPLYFLAITILLAVSAFGMAQIKSCSFAHAYTYTLNFASKNCNHQTMSHFWSLAVEEHFYLIWPIVFAIGARFALTSAVAFAAACVYFGVSLFSGLDEYNTSRWTFPAAAPIAFGCIGAFLANKDIITKSMSDSSTSGAILMFSLAGLASPAFTSSNLIWLISITTLILYIYHNQGSLLVRALEIKPLSTIGLISYGLYVWQGVFTGNGPYRTNSSFPPNMDFGLWIAIIAAPIGYIFFERPILRLKSKFSRD